MKAIIVHYSRSGHTEGAAARLAEALKSKGYDMTIRKVETAKGKIWWLSAGAAGYKQKDIPVKTPGIDLSPYDLIVAGGPIWAGKPAPVVKTYLGSCRGLKGKTVHHLISSGGPPKPPYQVFREQLKEMGAELSMDNLAVRDKMEESTLEDVVQRFVVDIA